MEVPSPLLAAPLVVRRKMLWQLRRRALRVLDLGAQADARPAVRTGANNRARITYAAAPPAVRNISGARLNPVTIAEILKALS
jgi:hypothetical protein